jgi:hypothetical protein
MSRFLDSSNTSDKDAAYWDASSLPSGSKPSNETCIGMHSSKNVLGD